MVSAPTDCKCCHNCDYNDLGFLLGFDKSERDCFLDFLSPVSGLGGPLFATSLVVYHAMY